MHAVQVIGVIGKEGGVVAVVADVAGDGPVVGEMDLGGPADFAQEAKRSDSTRATVRAGKHLPRGRGHRCTRPACHDANFFTDHPHEVPPGVSDL